jgi:peptidyl-prolyl cis-trans isomerase SurA
VSYHGFMRFPRAIALAGAIFAIGLSARPAQAVIVERIVAIVGEKPVLLSELRHRARPRLIVLAMQQPDQARQAAGETQAFKETLDEMINERLFEQAADKGHVGVSVEEVDRAMRQKADSLRTTLPGLLAEASREGFSEQDYRDEIRRQLLEGKMIQLRVQGRVRVTDQDARAAYTHFLKEIGDESPVELQAIAMQLVPSPSAIEAKKALAQEIVMQARAGADYCELVKKYTDDTQTKDTCGSRGLQPVKVLFPVVREQLAGMKQGDVSNPIVIGDQAIVIFRLAKREAIPPYEQMKDQMMERATGEAVERQRKLWIDELRRGTFLEIRL